MTDKPADGPGEGDDEQQNPFKGTPFEHLFGAGGAMGGMGGMGGAGGQMPDLSAMFGGKMPDLNQIMSQIQSLMQPYDGPVNWDLAVDTARKTVAQQPDPSPSQRQKDAVADALGLADHWLDTATELPSAITSTGAWSRAEWVVGTQEVWRGLVEPVAAQSAQSLSGALPEEAQAMGGPLLGMLGTFMGSMLATQAGSGIGTLASEVLSVSDVGLPLAPAGRAALLPANIESFAEGLDVGYDDVLLYLALREAAHQRLYGSVPWLREHVLGAVKDYGRGIDINTEAIQARIEEQMRGVDPSNPESVQQLLEGGLFDLPRSPLQVAALERLEIVLALVEGWVDEVVGQATEGRMPAAAKLQEAVRRRRAAGGPPRRRSRPWWASSCARVGCATPPPCGARCAPARARRPATGCGPTPTCCRRRPTSTTRWASATRRTHPRRSATRTSTPSSPSCWAAAPRSGPTSSRAPTTSEPARRRRRGALRLERARRGPGGAARALPRPPARLPRGDAS